MTANQLLTQFDLQVEDIKRVNKIFTNESVFVRKTVLIPRLRESLSKSSSPTAFRKSTEMMSDDQLDANAFLANIDRQLEETKEAVNKLEASGR